MRAMPTSTSSGNPCRRMRQRGSISVLAAIWLGVAVAALGVIDIGEQTYLQRNLQSVADMAASAGAQVANDGCTRAPATALGNAGANGFDTTVAGSTITTTCGRWDATVNAGPSYFAAAASSVNAVSVTAQQQVPVFFLGPARTITATAVAKAVNLGQFSIGTSLLTLNPVVITGLLNSMLGTSINALSLSAASYTGLANSRIEIGDLVTAAGVGTVDQLLATRVTAGQLAQLMLTALQTTHVLNASASVAVGALQAIIAGNFPGGSTAATFPLGNVAGTAGLLSVGLANTQSALHATISPFDALLVAADIAQAGKSALNVGINLNLASVASTTLQLQVIQPPVLAVGEAGKDSTGAWRTLAHSAQIRAYLKVSLSTLSILGTSVAVTLPISVDVAPGTGWLQATQCATTAAASYSTVGVAPGILTSCVGDQPGSPSASTFSCTAPASIIAVTLLGIPVVKVATVASIPAVVPAGAAGTLTFDGIAGNADDYQTVTSNQVGGVLTNALSGLATTISNPNNLNIVVLNSIPISVPTLVSTIVGQVVGLLSSILPALDTVLDPILQLLGAQIGASTIHGFPPVCGQSQVVY